MHRFLLLVITSLFISPAWAQKSSSRPWLLSQGSAAREAKRFTLQSWLENKDRRALMDMWLTINTPSPYEFVLGGAKYQYTLQSETAGATSSNTHDNSAAEVSAYARFVGVTGEYTNNVSEQFNDVTGMFNLRVFGNTVQGTHITFHYGLRTRTAENKSYRLNQQFGAATLQIYLMKYFGIQGNYRAFTPYTENFYGETSANEINAGAFIEFGSVRLFGDWYQEKQNSKLNSVETNINRTGNRFGLKIFF